MSELRRLNPRTVAIVLTIALVIVVINALTTGAYTIKFGEVFKVLFQGPAATSDAPFFGMFDFRELPWRSSSALHLLSRVS